MAKAWTWSDLHFLQLENIEYNNLLSRIISFAATYHDSIQAFMHSMIPTLPLHFLEKSDSWDTVLEKYINMFLHFIFSGIKTKIGSDISIFSYLASFHFLCSLENWVLAISVYGIILKIQEYELWWFLFMFNGNIKDPLFSIESQKKMITCLEYTQWHVHTEIWTKDYTKGGMWSSL